VGILTVPNIILTPPGARNVSARMAGLPWGPDYIEKIQRMFGSSLIGFRPMGEPPGTTAAIDYSPLQNPGVYNNVALGQQGLGDGQTCALFNGGNSYIDAYSAAFNSYFNPARLTVGSWARVSALADWTNGEDAIVFRFGANANNLIDIDKYGVDNRLYAFYNVGGVPFSNSGYLATTTDWFHIGVTVDKEADALKLYFNGAQVNNTVTGLGTWVGALAPGWTNIGRSQITTDSWRGTLAYHFDLNRAATPAEMAQVAER